jgi:hypothetical protein
MADFEELVAEVKADAGAEAKGKEVEAAMVMAVREIPSR